MGDSRKGTILYKSFKLNQEPQISIYRGNKDELPIKQCLWTMYKANSKWEKKQNKKKKKIQLMQDKIYDRTAKMEHSSISKPQKQTG